jgi:hypothetical protein
VSNDCNISSFFNKLLDAIGQLCDFTEKELGMWLYKQVVGTKTRRDFIKSKSVQHLKD